MNCDHQHRPGLGTVDDHRRHQDRRRRRAWNSQRQRRYQGAGYRGVVAGFGGHQTFDRALAEQVALAARTLGSRVGRPGCHVLADAGKDADEDADQSRAQDRAPVPDQVADLGKNRVDGRLDRPHLGLAHHHQDLGEAERADERRDEADAAAHRVLPEGESW
jgi:hypothetical protein